MTTKAMLLTVTAWLWYSMDAALRSWQRVHGVYCLRTFYTKAGDSMSDFEIMSLVLAIIGLLMTAFKLGQK